MIIKVQDPRSLSRDQYLKILAYLVEKHENTGYRRQILSCLNRFLARHQNYIFSSVHFKWEIHVPRKVFWLNQYELGQIWATPMDPVERVMIWMESRLGARRIEVLRQYHDDLDLRTGKIYLRGKGGQGTKGRRLAIPPSGYVEIPRFNEFREMSINKALDLDPEWNIPKEWIIYWTNQSIPRLTTLSLTQSDNFINRVSERSGIKFTGHTLRRTYGRSLFEAGVELITISRILGHSSVKTTERYLGINDDDIEKGMVKGEHFYRERIEIMESAVNAQNKH